MKKDSKRTIKPRNPIVKVMNSHVKGGPMGNKKVKKESTSRKVKHKKPCE